MPGEIGTAYVAVKLDPTGIRQGIAQTEAETTKRFGQAGTASGKALAAGMKVGMVGLGVVGVGMYKAINAASDLNEEINKTQVVFGKQGAAMMAWSKTSADAMGLSQQQALAAAGAYGNMFSTIGLGQRDAAGMSQKMVQLAADMASFHNQDPTDMLDKLRSGLSGEAEPLRQFGVLLSEASVAQFAYQNGIAKTGSKLTEAQKVQARYGLIMEQTNKAHGDFARTSDGLANQQRILKAQLANVSAQLGTAFLPAVVSVAGVLTKLVGVLQKYPGLTKGIVIAVTALSVALVAAGLAAKAYGVWIAFSTEGTFAYAAAQAAARVATVVWTAAQWLLNAALTANPIGIVVVAVIALAAAFVIAYKKSETFRNIVNGAFEAVKKVAVAVFDAVRHAVVVAFNAITKVVSAAVNFIKAHWKLLPVILLGPMGIAAAVVIRHWGAIKNATSAAWGAIVGIVKRAVGNIKQAFAGMSHLVTAAADLGKRIGTALVNAIINAFSGIADRIRGMLPDVSSITSKIPGLHAVAPPGSAVAGYRAGPPEAAGLAAPSLQAGGGGGGLAGPVPLGAGFRRALRGFTPAPVAAAPITVRVYIGDHELRSIVRVEVDDANSGIARRLMAGGVA